MLIEKVRHANLRRLAHCGVERLKRLHEARNDCPVLRKINRVFAKDLMKRNAYLHKKSCLPTPIDVPSAQNCLSFRNVSPSAEIIPLCGF